MLLALGTSKNSLKMLKTKISWLLSVYPSLAASDRFCEAADISGCSASSKGSAPADDDDDDDEHSTHSSGESAELEVVVSDEYKSSDESEGVTMPRCRNRLKSTRSFSSTASWASFKYSISCGVYTPRPANLPKTDCTFSTFVSIHRRLKHVIRSRLI